MSQGNMGVGFAIPSNAIREVLPQLRSGKVTRGRVGVQVGPVRRQEIDELGLKEKAGAVVSAVEEKGPAEKAGVEIGDVILAWNGQPVRNSDELVRMVVRTKPGASIPVRIVRDKKERTLNITVEELDLETEGNPSRRVASERTSAEPEQNKGFGMTLENVIANCSDCPGWSGPARRVKLPDTVRGAVITDIDPGSPADESRRLQPGDIIYRVGTTPVTSALEAQRELNKVPAGGTALLRVIRPAGTSKGYQELFLTVTKD
jgi:serine protease Do